MSDPKKGLPTEIHEEKRGPDVTTRVEPMSRVELIRKKDPTEQEVTKCGLLQNLPRLSHRDLEDYTLPLNGLRSASTKPRVHYRFFTRAGPTMK